MKTNVVQHMIRITTVLGLMVLFVFSLSCRRDLSFAQDGVKLTFSKDTVYLDTVFSGVGSSTYTLRVFNPGNEAVMIDRIFLARGQQSNFRMNVDGNSTKDASNVEILPKDSMHIFLEVTGDASGQAELLYEDSIIFINKDVKQWVNVVTLVEDAYFIFPTNYFPDTEINYSVFPCDTTINGAGKPVVVYGYAVVDAGCKLTIENGARIHFHKNSGLWVFNGGTLHVNPDGNADYENPVVFQGDRLEPFYRDIPGQWGGSLGGVFVMGGSVDNIINNAIVKNGTIGIVADSTTSSQPNLTISNTRMFNFSRAALFGGFGHMEAENVVAANCGLYAFYALGGRYSFKHCTFANYWNQSSRSTPAVGLFNFFESSSGGIEIREIQDAYFGNCVIYGVNRNELEIVKVQGTTLNYRFNHLLLKAHEDAEERSFDITDSQRFTDVRINLDPVFEDVTKNLYAPDSSNSPLIDRGNISDGSDVFLDIRGNSRSPLPDLGAYQYVP